MAHTRKAAILIIDELQEKLKDQDIALAKRLEWIRKVEAQKADLLAALEAAIQEVRFLASARLHEDNTSGMQWLLGKISKWEAAIERNS